MIVKKRIFKYWSPKVNKFNYKKNKLKNQVEVIKLLKYFSNL